MGGEEEREEKDQSIISRSFFMYFIVPLVLLSIVPLYGEYKIQSGAVVIPQIQQEEKPQKIYRTVNDNEGDDINAYYDEEERIAEDEEKRHAQRRQHRQRLLERQQQQQQQKKKQARQNNRAVDRDHRIAFFNKGIEKAREHYKKNFNDPIATALLADVLRNRDMTILDGGGNTVEVFKLYKKALDSLYAKRVDLQKQNLATDIPKGYREPVQFETYLDYYTNSIDGLISQIETNVGKIYFMQQMFEAASESLGKALEIKDNVEAWNFLGSTSVILGDYDKAAKCFMRIIDLDFRQFLHDAIAGIMRILIADEDVVTGGWDWFYGFLQVKLERATREFGETVQKLTAAAAASEKSQDTSNQQLIVHRMSKELYSIHLSLFHYYDLDTQDIDKAAYHLDMYSKYKVSVLAPYNEHAESKRAQAMRHAFSADTFTPGIGNKSKAPIFIIGFPRSGSTLLERTFNAHSKIAGTGEDSIFNGKLTEIRDVIVKASATGQLSVLDEGLDDLGYDVLTLIRERHERVDSSRKPSDQKKKPIRFVDKMLTNFNNVGFIHMVYPNALILHVMRDPMDCLFSAYKHDFTSGTLDYTSDFEPLASMYKDYRDMIDHWERVLPGRITHVKYEDMVKDTEGVSRAIIAAAGLKWEDDILDFKTKKYNTNTMSSTQVNKGIYSHHLKAWKKYETYLNPLVELLGNRVELNLETRLPGYIGGKF